ncbi:PQQ-dependent sugar dehydrogenase [Halobacillus shinanisalinarum]|uniref:PQQ-dependent sugar dehydrogenase n=1 Tax=Halobacillus shinanisalinarum TaxID=2932258 RepID=A0ABY4H482_9BACI|nr:PQQ-dependent sugar dehydrogenase [Halobacillus shinanisalinarum]UOQ95228.1 PQQ-dependent sugar dehydrogenase [Halobacillus shinanisalinarum]
MRILMWLMVVLMMTACQPKEESSKQAPSEETGDTKEVAANLQSPWDIEANDGTIFITEREGQIVSLTEEQGVSRAKVVTEKGISQIGEGGLLGFKLDPNFNENHQAFAYHTYEENEQVKNRVIVLTYENSRWLETDVVLEDIPGANFHNGGRIEIGPDRKLYVTTGDSLNEDLAQDKESLAGKILRLNLDGSVPEDNPFEGSYVYSYGHRNPQGLAWDKDGQLYASEHGPDNYDEVNKINPGDNYGWPDIVGEENADGVEGPIYQTGENTWAPSGIAAFNERLYIATLRGTALRTLSFGGENPSIVVDDYGRIRDVEQIGESIYFITNNTDGRGSPEEDDDRLIKHSP